MSAKARVYCVNHECTKRHLCARYISRPLPGMSTREYKEVWNQKECEKYVPTVPQEKQAAYINIDEPLKQTGRTQSPADIELREYLVKVVTNNFDTLFMNELAWRSGGSYNVPKVAGRVVDLLLPVIKRNLTIRKR